MSQSLFTGASGLKAHQQKLDIVANNLANLNTTGFKSARVVFSDLIYNTIRNGTASTSDNLGGTTPLQIGTGVKVSQMGRRFTQGTLESTGEVFDFGLQGKGFFVLKNPSGQNVYTRAGSFALDSNGNLVDPSTGYLVQRHGTIGDKTTDQFGFQKAGDTRIKIPLGAPIPGKDTSSIKFAGNVPSTSLPALAEVLKSVNPYEASGAPATLATLLNDLDTNEVDYVGGDTIDINGTQPDGTPFTVSLPADGTTTVGDLITAIDNQLVGATASLDTDGSMLVTTDAEGDAFSSLLIADGAGNTGRTRYSQHGMQVETNGKFGDIFESSLLIYDKRGESHSLKFAFQKQTDNQWDLTVSLNDGAGVFIDDQVLDIRFNEDGTFFIAGRDGIGDTKIELNWDALQTSQPIEIDFSEMTHLATDFSLTHQQDGIAPGNLVSVGVTGEGILSAISSNGVNFPLAQLTLASFPNVDALEGAGSNYFYETPNSGVAQLGSGLTGGRAQVVGNQLETSNVDVAQEFTQLIVAQRGFSANARIITVAEEMLEELTNIIR